MTKSTLVWTLLGIFVVLSGARAVGLIQGSRSEYLTWRDQRAAWHTRCDAYIGQSTKDPIVAACQRDLNELLASAKRQGWNR